MRVIVDANVAIAAVASRGLCEAVMELCLEHHQVVLCEGILEEIEAKLRTRIKVPPGIVADYVRFLRSSAQMVESEEVEEGAGRDPDDLMILGLVVPGNAAAIVTGDHDLLVIGRFRQARIMSPRTFWEFNQHGE